MSDHAVQTTITTDGKATIHETEAASPARVHAAERAVGCMVGLAVGDAIGDLGRSDLYRQRYGIITELYEGAKSTDDTEFAVLTAQTLIDNNGQLTLDRLVESWRKYILGQGGMGTRGGKPLYGAVANLERGMLPPLSGIDNVANDDDGAAMRIAPIGILCAGDPHRAAQLAEIESCISHARDGIWGAQAVAASVAVAMVSEPTGSGIASTIVAAGVDHIPADSWLGRSMARTLEICQRAGTIEAVWEELHNSLWTASHSSVAEALPQAYAIFQLTGGDFRKGMFWAANFGRDADTISAVVGALCGALHGERVIPTAWQEKVRRPAGVCLKFAAEIDIPMQARKLAALI